MFVLVKTLRIRTDFSTCAIRTFSILEKAAKDADSFLGQHLFESLNQKKMKKGTNPAKATVFKSNTKRYNVCATMDQVEETRTAKFCVLCVARHPLWVCEVFKNQSVQERSKLVNERRLCYNCLEGGHFTNECKFRKCCSICGRKHNTLLHRESQPPSKNEQKTNDKESQDKGEEKKRVCSSNGCCDIQVSGRKLHKVVPVKVWTADPSEEVTTWAIMDEGSETSLCTYGLAHRLKADLSDVKIALHTSNSASVVNKQMKGLHIQGVDESTVFRVPEVLIQDNIVDVSSSIPTNGIVKDYSHLKDLKFPALISNQVELLLGQNVQNAFRVSELRYGDETEPHGLHTALGWALWGNDQRWSRGHKAQGQEHKKNPRPRTAFPRTDTLEAKDRNAQGQRPRTQAQMLSKQKKKKRSSQKFFKRSPKKKKRSSQKFFRRSPKK